jgi:CBS domain containing-hemolysin-like protein
MFTFYYVALVVCLLLVALFAASEAALAATSRVRLRQLLRARADNEDNSSVTPPGEMSRDEQRFIASVTVAANVPLVIAAGLAVWVAQDIYGLSPEAALICLTTALLAVPFFQIVPRLMAAQPGALGQWWWVRPARLLVAIFRPPVTLLLWLGNLLLRLFGLMPAAASTSGGAEAETGLENASEIRDMVESVQASGALDEGKELIASIFSFGDTRVHEIMVPRPDIIGLPVECTFDRAMDTMQESGLSRLPIYEENIDRVVGVLHAKDVLRQWSHHGGDFGATGIRDLMREPLFLPETKKIDEALSEMRLQRSHLTIVIDEYGGTSGLITIEDILEELVGDIADEHDHKVEEPLVILDEHKALADALLHLDDLRDEWNLALPAGEFDTVGGFVIEQLGRAPAVGDQVETNDAILTVHAVRGRRPKKILITRKPDKAEVTS